MKRLKNMKMKQSHEMPKWVTGKTLIDHLVAKNMLNGFCLPVLARILTPES